MFRFTPTPVSSASIFWWCGKGGFADRKCTLDDTLDRWYDERFPPLSIYYGGKDYLVLCEPLLERLEKKEGIKPVRVEKLDISEVSENSSAYAGYMLTANAITALRLLLGSRSGRAGVHVPQR